MAGEIVGLASEERRRRWTIVALGSALFVSTVPITNERALFSPFGDIPILGTLSPVAYAVTFGYGNGGPGGNGGVPGRGGVGNRPPVAFAARVPPGFGAPPSFTTPATPSASSFVPSTPGSALPGAPGASSPPAPSGPSSGSGLPGGGSGGGGLPPPTPNPTPPVPEPATWVTLLFGFGVIGGLMRRSRRLGTSAQIRPVFSGYSDGPR